MNSFTVSLGLALLLAVSCNAGGFRSYGGYGGGAVIGGGGNFLHGDSLEVIGGGGGFVSGGGYGGGFRRPFIVPALGGFVGSTTSYGGGHGGFGGHSIERGISFGGHRGGFGGSGRVSYGRPAYGRW